ncbi:hypothetical protein [Nostoc sp.]|uniref:hypothetical protein n=1 Tax=Nostoc sp. TaxID=1180 RepID=UPI002FFC9363
MGNDKPLLRQESLSTALRKSVAFLMQGDALALQEDALTLYRDALALQGNTLTLYWDALALQRDALTMYRDALALQGITKFNLLQINEMLYLASATGGERSICFGQFDRLEIKRRRTAVYNRTLLQCNS